MSLAPTYQPDAYEQDIYQAWMQQAVGAYRQQLIHNPNTDLGNTHCILMPPPNLTGKLHAGHTFQHFLMDTLSRVYRQRGVLNLWYPGVDHAGLQLEGVINQLIAKGEFDGELTPEERDPIELKKNNPEKWLELAWRKAQEWRDNQKSQASLIGDTPDWERQLFTLDARAVDMVNRAFVAYWQDGLLYKSSYLISWSVGLQTALSDVAGEIDYQTRKDPLVTFGYKLQSIDYSKSNLDSRCISQLVSYLENHMIYVSTVRPETIFGDVAVAMHPNKFKTMLRQAGLNDIDRHAVAQALATKDLQIWLHVPVLGVANVRLITAKEVEEDFGTGALKITPASDMADYHIFHAYLGGSFPQAIRRDGRLSEICGDLAGLDREEARVEVMHKLLANGYVPLKDQATEIVQVSPPIPISETEYRQADYLQKAELLRKAYPQFEIDWEYEHNVTICERSKTVIEPMISEEFFLSYQHIATSTGKNLQTHGKEGVEQTDFFSKDYKARAVNFLDNIQDWCISRDLIWGHRMPIWYDLDTNPKKIFGKPEENITGLRIQADKPNEPGNWVQEEKILDTWFSSCLWPLSTLDFAQTADYLYLERYTDLGNPTPPVLASHLVIYSTQKQAYLVESITLDDQESYQLPGTKITGRDSVVKTVGSILQKLTSVQADMLKLQYLGRIGYTQSNHSKSEGGRVDSQVVYAVAEEIFDQPESLTMDSQKWQWVSYSDLLSNLDLPWVAVLQQANKLTTQNPNYDLAEFLSFYPTQQLTTARDIFYTWIVRMITVCHYFTGRTPFESLIVTPTILDEKGRKMSKSLGNGLDPVESIHKYSADSLRLALLGGMIPNRNMRMGGALADSLCEKYRNFGNKIWNVARFLESRDNQEAP